MATISHNSKASVIIPAFNEALNIGHVVAAARACSDVDEVIVVDDGSSDRTASNARHAGADVISLSKNLGKGAAMDKGVAAARNDIIVFLDADIMGLTPSMISKLIEPLLYRDYQMAIAIRDRYHFLMRMLLPLHLVPLLGGERAVTKTLWHAVPQERMQGFQDVLTLNYYCKKLGLRMWAGFMPGLKQVVKEKKYGFLWGTVMRVVLVRDFIVALIMLYIIDLGRSTYSSVKESFVRRKTWRS